MRLLIWWFDKISVICQYLSLSLIIISSIDNRVTNHFIKLKIQQVQFFTNLSNLNAANNMHYTHSGLLIFIHKYTYLCTCTLQDSLSSCLAYPSACLGLLRRCALPYIYMHRTSHDLFVTKDSFTCVLNQLVPSLTDHQSWAPFARTGTPGHWEHWCSIL